MYSEPSMYSGRFVFFQLMEFFPLPAFRRCVQRLLGSVHRALVAFGQIRGHLPAGYETVAEIRRGLDHYFDSYNQDRFHQGLGFPTSVRVYRAA